MEKSGLSSKVRNSNLELFRIITMLVIIAHHYVVHSGLLPVVWENYPSAKSIFILMLGGGGKIGINCFILITGYFMCNSNITFRKFLKLFLQFYLYKVVFFAVFALSGYISLTPKSIIWSLMPIVRLKDGFVSCYLVFFCFIPFLNILIKGMTKRQHQLLLGLSLLVFSVFPNILIKVSFSYVSWFMVVYLIGSYLRLYPPQWSLNRKCVLAGLAASLMPSLSSVCVGALIFSASGKDLSYFFITDCNKPLAIVTAVIAFLFFKNLKMGYNKFINTVAASAFGVFLIHDNSASMKQWLWRDVLDNAGHFYGNIYLHAVLCILAVYAMCTLIDFLRIYFLEKPFFKWYDSRNDKQPVGLG